MPEGQGGRLMATIEKKCPTCGHVQTFTACPECKGKGVFIHPAERPAHLAERLDILPTLLGTRCEACGGTGIKNGKAIVT